MTDRIYVTETVSYDSNGKPVVDITKSTKPPQKPPQIIIINP